MLPSCLPVLLPPPTCFGHIEKDRRGRVEHDDFSRVGRSVQLQNSVQVPSPEFTYRWDQSICHLGVVNVIASVAHTYYTFNSTLTHLLRLRGRIFFF